MKIIIPIRGYDWPKEIELCNLELERLLEEISQLNDDPRLITLLDENRENKLVLEGIKISTIQGNENESLIELNKLYPEFHILYIWEYLVVELKFIKGKSFNNSTFYPNLYTKQLAALIGLTYGTPIEFLPGIVLNKRKFIGMTDYVGGPFNQAYDSMDQLKWPAFQKISFDQILSWMVKHEIHFHSVSNSPGSRAVNAYTHLFNYSLGETDSAFIFWCMLGIEALFSKGNTGIIQQIQSKIDIILGQPSQFKKKLKKLYEYRSRLVHGEYNFPAKFNKDFDTFNFEYQDYVGFACSLLIASIKTQIIYDKSEFEFNLVLK